MTYRHAYLHGFGSSPLSRKGQDLKARFEARGVPFFLPDLNVPSFEQLTYTGALQAMDVLDEREGKNATWRLVGSSMGGFVASRWAQLNPDRVDRLLLLCPAFDLMSRWPQMMGEEAFALWERKGAFFLTAPDGEPAPVHWGFVENANRHPTHPDVACPTRIIHGTTDEVVPIESSRDYAAPRPHVDLFEVNDGHDLAASLEPIANHALEFFEVV